MDKSEELVNAYINHILTDLFDIKKNQLLLNAHLEIANKSIMEKDARLENLERELTVKSDAIVLDTQEHERIMREKDMTINDLVARVNSLQSEANQLRIELEAERSRPNPAVLVDRPPKKLRKKDAYTF